MECNEKADKGRIQNHSQSFLAWNTADRIGRIFNSYSAEHAKIIK